MSDIIEAVEPQPKSTALTLEFMRIDAAISELITERDTMIVSLYVDQDMTLEEIARVCGLNRTTVSRLLRRHDVTLYAPGRPKN